MIYEQDIYISKDEDKMVKHYLKTNAVREEDNFNEDDCFTVTAKFHDGIEMDIKMCGVQFEEGGQNNTPWTEAVLFKNGNEITCTEPAEDFTGDWTIEYKENIYTVHIKVKDEK